MTIDDDLLARLITVESGGNPNAFNSVSGAAGPMQILESTARDPGYGVKPISPDLRYDPSVAIPFGRNYLSALAANNGGDIRKALAAYGEGTGYADKVLSTDPSPEAIKLAQQYGSKAELEKAKEAVRVRLLKQKVKDRLQASSEPSYENSASPSPSTQETSQSQPQATGAPPSTLESVEMGMANPWHAFNQRFYNLAYALPRDLGAKIPDWMPGAQYDAELKAREEAYQARRGPDAGTDWWRVGGEIIGSLPLAAVPGANTIKGSAGVGALAAFLTPQTSGEYSSLKDIGHIVTGAATGAGTAAAIQGGNLLLNALATRFGGNRANKIVSDALQAPGLTREESILRAREQLRMNPNLTLAEATGDLKTGRALIHASGETRALADRVLSGRSYDASNRVAIAARSALQAPMDKNALNETMTLAQKAAGPYYERAYQAPVPFTNELEELLTRPGGQAALKQAVKIAQNEGDKTLGQGFISIADDGTATFKQVPGMKVWDYVKRAYDDVIGAAIKRDGKVTYETRAIIDQKKTLVKALDDASPDYQQARAIWSGPEAFKSSMKDGEDTFFSLTPSDLETLWRKMSPTEQIAYRMGVAQKISDIAESGQSAGMLSGRLRDSRGLRKKLQIIGGDRAENLINVFNKEVNMKRNQNAMLSGSLTAETLKSMENLGVSDLTDVMSAAHGSPSAVARIGSKAWSLLTAPANQRTRNEAGRMLFSLDPREREVILSELLKQAGPTPYKQYLDRSIPLAALIAGSQAPKLMP